MPNQKLKHEARSLLLDIAEMLNQLSYDEYSSAIPILGNSSLGEHVRHILEMFHQLNQGYQMGMVNYDKRERNKQIQTDIDYAIEFIACLIAELNKADKELLLSSAYAEQNQSIKSSYNRELIYSIEHCVHHQALLKVGLQALKLDLVSDTFGLAKSTQEYRLTCAQ